MTRTHCTKGHLMTPANTYDNGECKVCKREKSLAAHYAKKAARREPIDQPCDMLERAIANESWTIKMPWERPGFAPTD